MDAFIAVSNYYKEAMCERLDLPAEHVYTVYNGINLDASSIPLPKIPLAGGIE